VEKEEPMTRLTRLATTALAALTAISIPAAAFAGGVMEEHKDLWNAIGEVGVTAFVNHPVCWDRDVDGFYSSRNGILIICQDNKTKPGKVEPWTDNDLDTLRHEAVHLIQDCKDGRRSDNSLVHIIPTHQERLEFFARVLGPKRASVIIKGYGNNGVSAHQIVNELEAFSFAADQTADNIAVGVRNNCGVN
jgi:hypothetical protein